jgi:murein DD-endopeptidase MepM/ murein hydrolase activator NlpD
VLVVGICTWPNRRLVIETSARAEFGRFGVVPVGYVGKVDAGLRDLMVNGRRLSYFKQYGVFVLGPRDPNPSILSRLSTSKTHFWQHPKVKFEFQEIKLDKPNLKEASQLRIPATIWQNLLSVSETEKLRDRQKLEAALKTTQYHPLNPCFDLPLNSLIVSKYASPRSLPNGDPYYHTGVDLRGGVGTTVRSSGTGKVVLAEHMTVPGNNILISHGDGFYSRYMHLSQINVRVGDVVQRGQVVGKVGATGRVEAPHLHWEILWKGTHADPHRFLQAMAPTCDQG